INLKSPYPQILYWRAMHFTTPVAREAVEYYDGKEHPDGPNGKVVLRPEFKWHPVSTGPYRIVEHKPSSSYRLVRNPNYNTTTFPTEGWPAEQEDLLRPLAGKKLPLIDEVQMPIIREQLPAFLLTRQGYLDRGAVGKDAFNSVVTASLDLAPHYKERGISLEKDVTVSTFYISMNTQDPVLGPNKKLRQALSASFDARSWVDIFYNGVAEVAQQLLSPGIYGFQEGYKNPYGYDLAKARQLMVEAGYPNGIDPKTGRPLELTLDAVAGDSWQRQTIEFDQRCFEQLGIRIKVVENTFARMLEKEDQGNYQLASGTGWGADYPDPENYYFLFYSKNFPPAGKNISRFKNEEFDQLFEKMATMENGPERLKLVHRMNEIFAEECPVILNFNKAFFVMVQPWAPRTHNNQMLEGGIKYAITDPKLREAKQRAWNNPPEWPIFLGVGVVLAGLGYAVRLNKKRNA
ncbi:MAG: ABC transporter substrate-binding protein, partial [Chthoniobacteraceae bacterium]